MWVTARAEEQRDGSPQLLRKSGQLGCSTEHRPRTVIKQSGWKKTWVLVLAQFLSLGWFLSSSGTLVSLSVNGN